MAEKLKIKVFFLEPTNEVARSLRRFVYSNRQKCTANPHGYHNAMVPIEPTTTTGPEDTISEGPLDKADLRWPKACGCGYVFQPEDQWQVFMDRVYRRVDNGQKTSLREAPVGAMWFADWMLHDGTNVFRGPDGHCLVVKCPPEGHQWMVDSRCSNCGSPTDNVHKCWVRHGDPRTGNVHVDKQGNTCAAGAGSIQIGGTPGWHGYLHDGYLVDC